MTRIILEGYGEINIEDGTNFPLTFNVQDVKNPSSISSSYSKNVVIIGNKDTNKIFNHAYDVNVQTTSFDVNKRVPCQVIQGGASVFEDAFFQLLEVEKVGDRIKYTGKVKSNMLNFFTELKGRELTDLSIFNNPVELTPTNIRNSFTNTVEDKFKFIPHFTDDSVINVNNFRPAIYLKTFFDAIHETVGYQYEFEQAEEVFFDKLLIPATEKWEANKDEIDYLTVILEKDGTNGSSFNFNTQYAGNNRSFRGDPKLANATLVSLSTVRDNVNQFNTSTNLFTPYAADVFSFKIELKGNLNITLPSSSTSNTYELFIVDSDADTFSLAENDQLSSELYAVVTTSFGNQYTTTSIENKIGDAGDTFPHSSSLLTTYSGTLFLDAPLGTNETIANIQYYVQLKTLQENDGGFVFEDQVLINVDWSLGYSHTDVDIRITPKGSYSWGVPVYLNKFIPKGVKCRDFVKSVMTMYNLVCEMDPDKPNNVIYKTRDRFYDTGEEKDWTHKIDVQRPHKLEWIQDKQSKNHILTYKEDNDVVNESYTEATKDVYGELDFEFKNEFNIGEEKEEVIFSPTPILRGSSNGMFLLSISAEPEKKYNIRIAIDGGISQGWWYFRNQDGSLGARESDYPYVGHLNNPFNPSFDLNFGACAFYFIDSFENPTQNNLFNLFHRRRFNQLSTGRILTAYFNLTPLDILNFKLNDKIYVDDTLYNINRIVDYNANKSSLTKVELITADEGLETAPSVSNINNTPATATPTTATNGVTINTGGGITGTTPTTATNGTTIHTGGSGGTGNVISGGGVAVNGGTSLDDDVATNTTVRATDTHKRSLKISGNDNNVAMFDKGHIDIKGSGSKVSTRQSTEITGDNNEVRNTKHPSKVIGDNNKLLSKSSRLIVGDNLTGKEGSDILSGKIEAVEGFKTKQLEINEDALVKTIRYVEEGYVVDGYVEVERQVIKLNTFKNYTIVNTIDDLPTADAGVIYLEGGKTYVIANKLDLGGARLETKGVANLFGFSSETSSITSTGLGVGVPLVTSIYSLVLQSITFKDIDTAISIDGNTNLVALDWKGVNFMNVPNIGTVNSCDNITFISNAFLNSKGFKLTGTIGTIGVLSTLFRGDGLAGNIIELDAACVVTRRFRISLSSFVVLDDTVGINVNVDATIPIEGYILKDVNFSGGGVYQVGVLSDSNKALFSECVGISNTAVNGQMFMNDNATATTITNTTDFFKVAGVTLPSDENEKYAHANNRLTNKAVIERKYLVMATLSFNAGNGNVCEFGFFDSELSGIRTPSKTKSTANAAGRAEHVSMHCIVNHEDGDFIEVHARNTSATTDITVTDMNVVITEIK